MKKIIKILIIILILISIVLIASLYIINKNEEKKRDIYTKKEINTQITPLKATDEYFAIKTYIEKYFSLSNIVHEDYKNIAEEELTEEQIKNAIKNNYTEIYNYLDKDYIKEFSIDIDTLISKYKNQNKVDRIYNR